VLLRLSVEVVVRRMVEVVVVGWMVVKSVAREVEL
jgi:hypothetical protein